MDNLKNEHIILSKGLNLSEIINTVKNVKKDNFVVYIPDAMEVLYNPINLKIFVKELKSDLNSKKISFFSTDSHLVTLFKNEGIKAETSEPTNMPNSVNSDKNDLGDFFKFETLNEFDGEKEELIKKEDKINIEKIADEVIDKEIINQEPAKLKNKFGWILYSLVFLLIIGGTIFATLYFSTVNIKLFPRTTLLTKEMNLVFNLNKDELIQDQIYLESKKIESQVELEVDATGSVSNDGTKAQGEVILKNETGSNQTLVEQTRLISDDKKIYKISKSITVPENGQISVTMIAENVGEEYNITEGKLLIPGFEKDKDKYEKIYAILEKAVNNGSSNGSKIVTENDINQAKLQLKENLSKDLNEKALQVKEDGYSVLDIGSTLSDIVYTNDVNPGQQAEKFIVKASSSLDSLIYSNKDVENYIKNNISKDLEEGKSIMPSLKVVFSLPEKTSDNGIINAKADIDYSVISIIDKEKLSQEFVYKNRSFVEDYLNSNYDLDNYNIELNPSFLPIMPILSKNIKITIEENKN